MNKRRGKLSQDNCGLWGIRGGDTLWCGVMGSLWSHRQLPCPHSRVQEESLDLESQALLIAVTGHTKHPELHLSALGASVSSWVQWGQDGWSLILSSSNDHSGAGVLLKPGVSQCYAITTPSLPACCRLLDNEVMGWTACLPSPSPLADTSGLSQEEPQH